jgi:predicted PurR-regulated permease PerM
MIRDSRNGRCIPLGRLAWYAFVALGTLAALYILWRVHLAVVLFLLSLAVAAAFHPAMDYLMLQRRISRPAALLLTYGLVLLTLGVFIFVFGGAFIVEIGLLADDLAMGYETARMTWPRDGNALQRLIAQQMPAIDLFYDLLAGEQVATIAQEVASAATGLFDVLGRVVIIVILSAYWGLDHIRFERLWLSLLPARQRARAREIWRDTESAVGAYIRRETLQSLLLVVFLWPGYRLLGLQQVTILALVAGALRLIPWLGVPLVLLISLGVGMGQSISCSICPVLYAGAVLAGIQVAVRRLLPVQQRFSSLFTAFIVVAMTWVFGLLGALLAPLLSLALQTVGRHLLGPALTPEMPESPDAMDELTRRLEQARARIAGESETMTPAIANLMQRLEGLVERTNALRGR